MNKSQSPPYEVLFVDTETGGLDPSQQSILSLGAVLIRDGEIKEQCEIFIREPEIRIDSESYAIHGIDQCWLNDHGLSPLEAVKALETFVDSCSLNRGSGRIVLGGHNVGFDMGFMRRLYSFTSYSFEKRYEHRSIDTSSILAYLIHAGKLDIKGPSSDAAFEHFGISFRGRVRHSAMHDAQATAQLYLLLLELICD